jgi:hypothetical protein
MAAAVGWSAIAAYNSLCVGLLESTYNTERKNDPRHHVHLIFSSNFGEIHRATANSIATISGLMCFFLSLSRSSMGSAYSP